MGILDRLRQKQETDPFKAWWIGHVRRIYQEERIPFTEESLAREAGEMPRLRLYKCVQCHQLLMHAGETMPAACPECGRPLQEVPATGGDVPLDPRARSPIAAQGHYGHALECFKRNDPPGAAAALTRAVELQPDFVDAWHNRSEARIAMGDLKGAIEDCDQVIRLSPKDAGAYVNRGSAKAQAGDFAGCVADTSAALSLGYDKPIAYFNRGAALFRLRDPDAHADLRRFLELSPNDGRADAARAMLKMLGET